MICWTLGITEHHNAVDNVVALINLALLTGKVGRYGCGSTKLRGQNNVQGGGDMGAIPARMPTCGPENPDVHAKFSRAWGGPFPHQRDGTSARCSRRWTMGDPRAVHRGREPGACRPDASGPPARRPRPGRGTSFSRRPPRWRTSCSRRPQAGRIRGHDQQRAPRAASAARPRAARRRATTSRSPRMSQARRRLGTADGRAADSAQPVTDACGDGTRGSTAGGIQWLLRETHPGTQFLHGRGRTVQGRSRLSTRSSTTHPWTG
jgi:hypothetical protein